MSSHMPNPPRPYAVRPDRPSFDFRPKPQYPPKPAGAKRVTVCIAVGCDCFSQANPKFVLVVDQKLSTQISSSQVGVKLLISQKDGLRCMREMPTCRRTSSTRQL